MRTLFILIWYIIITIIFCIIAIIGTIISGRLYAMSPRELNEQNYNGRLNHITGCFKSTDEYEKSIQTVKREECINSIKKELSNSLFQTNISILGKDKNIGTQTIYEHVSIILHNLK
jgi:hypothetical protein